MTGAPTRLVTMVQLLGVSFKTALVPEVGPMRSSIRLLVLVALCACRGQGPTEMNRLAPPTLTVSASTRVVSVASGAPNLEVSALLRNATTVRIGVAVGAHCPLFVRVFPDPTGEYSGSLDASMACPPDASMLELAPGDTTMLTRVLRADTLASFAPGTSGVNVAVTTSTGLIGLWAGGVQLPLARGP